jgi:hypothetical protein
VSTRYRMACTIGCALGVILLGPVTARAQVGTNAQFMLASFPSSGSNAGKYAAAWVDLSSRNCTNNASGTVGWCFSARADLTGRVLNAQRNVLNGVALAYHAPATNEWNWGYDVRIFGEHLAGHFATFPAAYIAMNVAMGTPLETHTAPFTVRGQQNLSLDLSVIDSRLGILPNARLTVNYMLDGGVTTEIVAFPASMYGPVFTMRVRPFGAVSANGSIGGNGGYYTVGPLRAKVETAGNVQVVSPGSFVELVGTIAFINQSVTLTETHSVDLLRGRVRYVVDGWLNPAGQLVDVVTEAGCTLTFGLICDGGTSAAWVTISSGNLWNQPSSYLRSFRQSTPNTLFSGVLPSRPGGFF